MTEGKELADEEVAELRERVAQTERMAMTYLDRAAQARDSVVRMKERLRAIRAELDTAKSTIEALRAEIVRMQVAHAAFRDGMLELARAVGVPVADGQKVSGD